MGLFVYKGSESQYCQLFDYVLVESSVLLVCEVFKQDMLAKRMWPSSYVIVILFFSQPPFPKLKFALKGRCFKARLKILRKSCMTFSVCHTKTAVWSIPPEPFWQYKKDPIKNSLLCCAYVLLCCFDYFLLCWLIFVCLMRLTEQCI